MSVRDELHHVAEHLPASAKDAAINSLIDWFPESWLSDALKLLCQADADAREPDKVGSSASVDRTLGVKR